MKNPNGYVIDMWYRCRLKRNMYTKFHGATAEWYLYRMGWDTIAGQGISWDITDFEEIDNVPISPIPEKKDK